MRRALRPRVVVPAVIVAAASAWALAAGRGLDRGAVYFYTPSEALALPDGSQVVRVGGQVAERSIRWDAERGVLRFRLTDGAAAIPVANRGAPPDLFRAGAGAVVEGRVSGGVLRSSSVIVKHDETYAPAEQPSGAAG